MPEKVATLSKPEARRIALAAQGFNGPALKKPAGQTDLRKLASQLHAIQIDSVNVLVRAHYMPAFSRFGPYQRDGLDTLAYKKRGLFEYWGHAACFLPMSLYNLFSWRMNRHRDNPWGTGDGRGPGYIEAVIDEVGARGPISASELSDPGKRGGFWWGWADGKRALEWLYSSGRVAVSGRRNFERLYDLTERVIPAEVLRSPAPSPDEQKKELITLAAQAMGVATAKDLTKYFNIDAWWERASKNGKRTPSNINALIAEVVEEGRLKPVAVEGWKGQAYMHPSAKTPAAVNARALVSPFDSLIWERDRTARVFDFSYSIEIYVPAPKRVYGYYVLPFLLGDTFVGRVDLKADRKKGVLSVPAAHREPGSDGRLVAGELAEELQRMAGWLQLDRIEVGVSGNLSRGLRTALKGRN